MESIKNNSDIALFYYGGVGGQIVFHLLHTIPNYSAIFYKNQKTFQFDYVHQYQWNNIDKNFWKSSEMWPSNHLTKKYVNHNRLFLYCNKVTEFLQDTSKTKIVLYTDIDTHSDLAMYKKAFWFTNTDSLSYLLQSYSKVKDPEWPVVSCVEDFYLLPSAIKKELNVEFGFDKNVFTDVRQIIRNNLSTSPYNGDLIFQDYVTSGVLEAATHVIKLQQVVLDYKLNLFDKIKMSYDKVLCDKLLKKWVDLHPDWLLDKIKGTFLSNP